MTTQTRGPAAAGIATADIRAAFDAGRLVERSGAWGRLVLDAARPFLVVLRGREAGEPLGRLVQGESSYLLVSGETEAASERARTLVRAIAEAGSDCHGAFLVVELWPGDECFRVVGPDGPAPATVTALSEGLRGLDLGRAHPDVEVIASDERHPPGLPPLLTVSESHELGTLLLGVAIPGVYRDPETAAIYPLFLRRLAHGFSDVLRRALFEFVRVQTGKELSSYRALGRRRMDEAVWQADRELAEIDASFDVLLLVAPTNADRAWERFRDSGYDTEPELHYRLLPIDPDLLKRRLYDIRLEDVEDPAAWRLMRDKREELDKQITLLADRNSPAFLHGSIRLYGHMQSALLERAEEILAEVPIPEPPQSDGRAVGADEFADRARAEFAYYQERYPEFESEIQVRPDLVGLMVSSGRLLIGRTLALRPGRVEALLQHEVGTHVLTFVNGAAQPLLQLSRGFADYDELQEGLGVLAEYLVDGLDGARMRLLAGRVVAVDAVMEGAGFLEVFRTLHRDHGFRARAAYDITTRVCQGGGFTRDMIYLRGLLEVVEYLRDGGELEPLYVGKIAARHLEVMRELRERGVLGPIPLLPRFLEHDAPQRRLQALRDGLPVHAMVSG